MYFKGPYYFLSNMYPVKISMVISGRAITFDNAEAAFQAGKCPDRADQFTNIDGYKAKSLGRHVPLRPDWEQVKLDWMYKVLCAKFEQNPQIADKLAGTGNEVLVEHNTWNDIYWGVCGSTGANHLGRLLMRVREEL